MFLKPRNRKHGSVLLEALLSTVILSVSITIIIQSMISSLRAAKYTADYTVALVLTDNKMNNLRVKKTLESGVREESSFNELDRKFNCLLQTSQFDEEYKKGVNQIDLDIWWKNGAKRNKIILSSYILDLGDGVRSDEKE
ncbi:MAG: hypothetical protein KKD07_01335 [Candidatus Omnitrophica bacterium]|nr:hypothetical protein [Candidatus Omnitrophota bacterium]MBU1996515.1 hypothetical protein [Candidatus Omnitrophota bacterium]MBU4333064.1 hypothetical protein [Candidatus Omnitrophota bacterium]